MTARLIRIRAASLRSGPLKSYPTSFPSEDGVEGATVALWRKATCLMAVGLSGRGFCRGLRELGARLAVRGRAWRGAHVVGRWVRGS
jgi:hypothetical protein